LPLEASSGAAPQSRAKVRSLRIRSVFSPAATSSAPAVSVPTPTRSISHALGARQVVGPLPDDERNPGQGDVALTRAPFGKEFDLVADCLVNVLLLAPRRSPVEGHVGGTLGHRRLEYVDEEVGHLGDG
jgi:hypothetical protein